METNIHAVFQMPARMGEPSIADLCIEQPTNADSIAEGRMTVNLTHADYTPSQMRRIAVHLNAAADIAEAQ